MTQLGTLLAVTHALLGALLLGGLVGRWVVLGLAERATSLADMRTLTRAATPFERVVIWGSQLVLLLGVVTAIVKGLPFLGPLQGGRVDWLFVSVLLYLSILPLIPLVFLPRGRIFEAAMEDAIARNEVTPSLLAAWRDPVVRAAHVYELAVVTLVFALMIAKPF